MNNNSINIMHMYPNLLNLYGDKGNIECMKRRLLWRGFNVNIIEYTQQNTKTPLDLSDINIIFLGGGSDREQAIVAKKLAEHKIVLKKYVEDGGALVAVCGGFQLLGKYYKTENATIEGLELLNISTQAGKKRMIGNIVLENEQFGNIVGFENHAGKTEIGNLTPLGKVIKGYGNNGESGAEGVMYKNIIATYLHGPLLPKNPKLCDYILLSALQRKFKDNTMQLKPLDDSLEQLANQYAASLG